MKQLDLTDHFRMFEIAERLILKYKDPDPVYNDAPCPTFLHY